MESSALLGIAAAAEQLGVTPSTLKRWADEGRVACLKTGGGHRRFRRADVERLLEEMTTRSGEARRGSEEWIQLLLEGDGHRLMGALFAARARLGAWYRVGEALSQALRLLGARWAQGRLAVLDEHLATERLRRALTQVAAGIPLPPEAPSCLLVTPPGEEHTLGLSIAELCLREQGWQSLWAGASVPARDMALRLARLPVGMVAAAASPGTASARGLGHWTLQVARACARKGIPLILGGAGAWPAPPPPGAVRVDGFTRFHEILAVAEARR